jgi:DNA modification methylase
VKNWSLRSAKALVIRELAAAEQSEMQALRHLRNGGEEWINIKTELGERGANIDDWCEKNMPVTRQWLDRHAELHKNWRKLLAARKWATEVGHTCRPQSGLEFALELIAAKNRSDLLSKESRLAADPTSVTMIGAQAALSRVTFLTGDALTMLRRMPDGSVDCCVTSPPWYGSLRDYGDPKQVGHEPTIEAYIEKLVAIFHEVSWVLTDRGSLWLSIGDPYASSSASWGTANGIHTRQGKNMMEGRRQGAPNGYKTKDLILLSAQVAMALQKDGWWLRNEVIWYKRGIRPENVNDRYTRTHEKIYLLTKSDRYWFAQDDVREPMVTRPHASGNIGRQGVIRRDLRIGDTVRVWAGNALGRNPRDVWEFATSKYKGAHPATFPPELVRRCLKASCPPDGHVIDPFAGAGTTGLVALELGHRATLIDLNPAYIKEARQRLAHMPPKPVEGAALAPMILTDRVTLYHGDCRDILPTIPDTTIDVVIADPPFFLEVPTDKNVIDHYIVKNGMKPRFRQQWDNFDDAEDYRDFSDCLLEHAARVIAPTGSVFVFAVHSNLGLIDLAIRNTGLKVLHHLSWAKRNPTPMISTRRLQYSHETIVWCVKTDRFRFNYGELKAAAYDGDRFKVAGRQHKDIIESSTSAHESVGHPAQKPVVLLSRLLDIAGRRGGVMLDPCAGTGTSAIAASSHGMRSILMERDASYVEIIRRRVLGNGSVSANAKRGAEEYSAEVTG